MCAGGTEEGLHDCLDMTSETQLLDMIPKAQPVKEKHQQFTFHQKMFSLTKDYYPE